MEIMLTGGSYAREIKREDWPRKPVLASGKMVKLRMGLIVLMSLTLVTPAFATFSIVAQDPVTGEMGYAVASKVLAGRDNGSAAEAGVGVVARQADLNFAMGRRAMELLRAGKSAQQVLDELLKGAKSTTHQLAILDSSGGIAVSTGPEALAWKGHRVGSNYSVQGNILAGPQVLDAMASAFEGGRGPLAERLLTALEAGDTAGGDRRGRQSAYIAVVAKSAHPQGRDRIVDFSSDDHPHPIAELRRLLDYQRGLALTLDANPHLDKGEFAAALAIAEQAYRLAPHPHVRMRIAMVKYLSGKVDAALEDLRKMRAEDPTAFDANWEFASTGQRFSRMSNDTLFMSKLRPEKK